MYDCPPGYCVNYNVSSEDVENLAGKALVRVENLSFQR